MDRFDLFYVRTWVAIRTLDVEAVAQAIDLGQKEECPPLQGVQKIDEGQKPNGCYLVGVEGWVLLFEEGQYARDTDKLAQTLSIPFQEAQFFYCDGKYNGHQWMRFLDGNRKEFYSYSQGMKEIAIGEQKPQEVKMDEEEYINEENVIKAAQSWSVDPSLLLERKDLQGIWGIRNFTSWQKKKKEERETQAKDLATASFSLAAFLGGIASLVFIKKHPPPSIKIIALGFGVFALCALFIGVFEVFHLRKMTKQKETLS